LIENLNAIDKCKQDIKTALKNKGVEMEGVVFAEYAEKIDALQLESGDTPTPTPSADYIYSNGYLTNGTETNEIVNLVPYEIELDDEGKCSFELTCPDEISVTNYTNYDIIFTVEIPYGYSIIENGFEIERLDGYETYQFGLKDNPRYKTIVRDNVTYSSFVRVTKDGDWYHDVESDEHDMATDDAMGDGVKYRLTIIKNNI
jgi:hypothetical protein